MATLEVVATDFQLFRGKVIEGKVEFEDRALRIFAVRIPLDHRTQSLQRLEGQTLVTAYQFDLVIIAEGKKVGGVGRVVIRRIEVDKPLCARAAVLVIFIDVIGISLHDQRALGPFGIGIQALNLAKQQCGFIGVLGVLQFPLGVCIYLLRRHGFDRIDLLLLPAGRHGQNRNHCT